jgi:vacuolar-type H+-ATPase subunit C/Vma6
MPGSAFGKLGESSPLPSETPEEAILTIDRELIADIRAIVNRFDEEVRPLIASGEYYFVCDDIKKLLSSLESITNCIPLFDNLRFCLSFVVIRLRSLQELIQKFCFKEDMDKHTQQLLIANALKGIDARIKELNEFFDTNGQASCKAG